MVGRARGWMPQAVARRASSSSCLLLLLLLLLLQQLAHVLPPTHPQATCLTPTPRRRCAPSTTAALSGGWPRPRGPRTCGRCRPGGATPWQTPAPSTPTSSGRSWRDTGAARQRPTRRPQLAVNVATRRRCAPCQAQPVPPRLPLPRPPAIRPTTTPSHAHTHTSTHTHTHTHTHSSCCSPSVVRNLSVLDEDRLDFELLEQLVAHIDESQAGREGAVLVFLPGGCTAWAVCAVLCCAVLCCAVLCCAVLCRMEGHGSSPAPMDATARPLQSKAPRITACVCVPEPHAGLGPAAAAAAGMGEIQELHSRLCASRRFAASSAWVIPLHSTVSPRSPPACCPAGRLRAAARLAAAAGHAEPCCATLRFTACTSSAHPHHPALPPSPRTSRLWPPAASSGRRSACHRQACARWFWPPTSLRRA